MNHRQIATPARLDGAPDVLFTFCQQELTDKGVIPFRRDYWDAEMTRYTKQGLRMLAAAYRPTEQMVSELGHSDIQQGMIFVGIAGMMDPPRPADRRQGRGQGQGTHR